LAIAEVHADKARGISVTVQHQVLERLVLVSQWPPTLQQYALCDVKQGRHIDPVQALSPSPLRQISAPLVHAALRLARNADKNRSSGDITDIACACSLALPPWPAVVVVIQIRQADPSMWNHHDLFMLGCQPFCPALALPHIYAIDLLGHTAHLFGAEALKTSAPVYVVVAAVVVRNHGYELRTLSKPVCSSVSPSEVVIRLMQA
jgi:hypothetical protein